MSRRFHHHYSRDEARALIPRMRAWLLEIQELQRTLGKIQHRLNAVMSAGDDAGGVSVNENIRSVAHLRELTLEFENREICIKDVDRGLVDIPSLMGGREVFLCWELDEEDIEYWHEIDAGFSGREKLSP